jgi:hypothetical protein
MWQHKDEFYWIKEQSGHVWVVIKHVQKGKCALLERGGAPTCELIHDLIGGALPLFLLLTLGTKGVVGHLAALTLHLAASSLHLAALSCPLGAPSPLGDFHLWLFIQVLSHCNLVGVWGLLLVVVLL